MSVVINGSAGVTTNSGAVYDGIQRGTSVASTSGTSIDFTSIPSWVRRITVMCSAISTSGTSNIICRIGTGGTVATTGYTGNITQLTNAGAVSISDSSNALQVSAVPSAASNAVATIVWANVTGNTWIGTSSCRSSATATTIGNSTITLSGTLNIVSITTGGGTDTFDAGTINIMYE